MDQINFLFQFGFESSSFQQRTHTKIYMIYVVMAME